MSTRKSEWEFEQSTRDGPFDVRRDRRLVQYDAEDLEEAMRLVRRHDPEAREVTVIDPDGYRHRERVT